MFYTLKEAKEMVKKGEAIFYNDNVLWIKLSRDTIRVCSWNSGLNGYTNCFISNEEPKKLDSYFSEFVLSK